MSATLFLPPDTPWIMLPAASAVGTGTIFGSPVERGKQAFATRLLFEVEITGAPTAVNVNIEGSTDPAFGHFEVLAQYANTTNGSISLTGLTMPFIRANLTTLTGGTAPTVTVTEIPQTA